jgi:bidirectional [NiFe] hydrogenase diaphorase subunit
MVKLTIDGQEVEVPDGTTVLEAAKELNIKIPTLCYNRHLKPYGGCRMCLVEKSIPNSPRPPELIVSCAYPAENGAVISTNCERVLKARRFVIELMLVKCPDSDEIKEIAKEYGISKDDKSDLVGNYLLNRATSANHTKCVLCGLCTRVCAELVGMSAISFSGRGSRRKIKTPFDKISQTCIGCGACAYLCPTKAIRIEEAS